MKTAGNTMKTVSWCVCVSMGRSWICIWEILGRQIVYTLLRSSTAASARPQHAKLKAVEFAAQLSEFNGKLKAVEFAGKAKSR